MRFLLVSITLFFSFIFYLFYTASLWKNIFLRSNDNYFYWSSLFWEMWISTLLFFLLTIGIFFYFKSKWNYIDNRQKQEQDEWKGPVQDLKYLYYFIFTLGFYILFLIILHIWNISIYYIVYLFAITLSSFFLWKYLFYNKKINKNIYLYSNIFSIISWYIVSVLLFVYYYFIYQDILLLFVFSIIGFFHIYIHLKYENIISLVFWIITFIYSLYRFIVYLFPWII